jgi:acyl carrier protein
MDDLKQKVRNILVHTLELPEAELDFDKPLITGLGISSIQLAELLAALENEFDIEIDNDEVVRMQTAQDVVRFLERTVGP